MAQSSYKTRSQNKTLALVQQLITHTTGFDRTNQNFKIAEEYAISNLTTHSFPDTDEHRLRRVYKNTCEKFFMHNQTELSDRLAYLDKKFRQQPLIQEGLSQSHDAIIHLLLELADRPTGPDGYNNRKPSKRIYFTKEEAQ